MENETRELVMFSNQQGNKLAGVIHKNNSRPSKFVVLVHGFTGNKDEKGLFVEASDCFVKKKAFLFFGLI